MLNWFRRQRLLAALLIAVNPALVGSWVTAYHPCPVRDGAAFGRVGAPALVASAQMREHADHEGMDMSSAEMVSAETAELPAPSHDHSTSDGPCSCIGQCLTSGAALPSLVGDEIKVAVAISQSAVRSPRHAVAVPASVPLDLLPPSTAPPIALMQA